MTESGLPAPISDTPWSAEFVMQSIEVLPLFLRGRTIHRWKSEHAESLRLGTRPGPEPSQIVTDALSAYGLQPRIVHSTSWRRDGSDIVLTFVAIVPGDPVAGSGALAAVPVARVELARGDEALPPAAIAVDQVVEHAVRHLAWLMGDDPAVRGAIPEWASPLAGYEPEPFRAL